MKYLLAQRAQGISQMASTHHELMLPQKPRLIYDIVLIHEADRIIAVGTREIFQFRSPQMKWIAENLLPALDGTSTCKELIQRYTDIKEKDLLDVLHLMYLNGILEDASYAPTTTTNAHYFSRYLDITGVNASGGEAAKRLSKSSVMIAGDGPLLRPLEVALKSADIRILTGGLVTLGISIDGAHCDSFAILNLNTKQRAVGPLTIKGDTPCPVCVEGQIQTYGNAIDDHELNILALTAAREAQNYLSGVFRPVTRSALLQLKSGEVIAKSYPVLRRSRCPNCGDPLLSITDAATKDNLAITVHNAVAIRSWMPSEKAGFRSHIKPEILALLEPTQRVASDINCKFLEPLATAFRLTTGFRYRKSANSLRRVIASAGDLGSVELLAKDQSSDFKLYDGLAHRAIEVEPPTGSAVPESDIILRSNYGKIAFKYGGRAVTYCILDAGLVLSRLSRILGLLGVTHTICPSLGSPHLESTEENRRLFMAGIRLSADQITSRVTKHDPNDNPLMNPGLRLALKLENLSAPYFATTRVRQEWSLESLDALLNNRESGKLTKNSIYGSVIQSILEGCFDKAPWEQETPAIQAIVCTTDVADFADGLYTVNSDGWQQINDITQDNLLENALLQTEHSTGHAFLLLGTDLAAWSRDYGDLGYKLALMAVGWRLDTLCLACTAEHCSATPTGGLASHTLKKRLANYVTDFDPLIGFVIGGTKVYDATTVSL